MTNYKNLTNEEWTEMAEDVHSWLVNERFNPNSETYKALEEGDKLAAFRDELIAEGLWEKP